ncbi:cell envelope integrity protein CreD [Acinetobacter baumannii]|uniref:cell envelope integrity protein CreD n=1 Tax=Acinetobacter baumannii TaxID=470 RepID=UPI000A33D698|nr:cell envelope integrity protein CreD [Acinetobacter baumannii]EKV4527162.1 cell envelope integrity protein CreD [Acinetobacter baumannii]MCT9367708.1 cell envelope integrity protein CreD [Acinetobacter baumannii]MDC4541033.1 cell envelope integrity protein CreD [Acinetobacter baumannii]MDC5064016.1 cell envelope integrity protein CreD [Acinetobacter baumannii]MDO7449226.1 cell envelope integrity protein CreD [Acinetobacter baumannii]
MRRNSINLKIGAVLFLILIFYIGLFFISSLVDERQSYQQQVIQDIAKEQIRPQQVIAPYLKIPYQVQTICTDEQKKTYACIQTLFVTLGAESTDWKAQFKVSDNTYKRNMYKAISYQNHMLGKGVFKGTMLESQRNYLWDQAEIIFPIQDARGLNAKPTFNIDGKNYKFDFSAQSQGQHGFDLLHITSKQYPELILKLQKGFSFSLQFDLEGLSEFAFIPTSYEMTYQAKGNWGDVKYDGQSLPFKKLSKKQFFEADWKNIALGKRNLDRLSTCANSQCFYQAVNTQSKLISDVEAAYAASDTSSNNISSISTQFLEPVNIYTQTDRAIKYGIMVIIITFGCFFLFEVLKSLKIHPVQYALVAMAQGVFFVLLLSISEYYAFGLAYLVAAVACIGLITWYLYFVVQGFKAAILFGVLLSALYGIMYLLLQSSGKTFLFGSILSFILIACVMYITRHVNWYQSEQQRI